MNVIKLLLVLFISSLLIGLAAALFLSPVDTGNVAVIPIEGPITLSGGGLLSPGASADLIEQEIDKAASDPMVDAVVFEINSPGGSAVASDEIVRKIRALNKTTVAVIRESGASGAYWIASATDHIIANPLSITGSIGVTWSYLSFQGLLSDYNITYNRIVTGPDKDIGSPYRNLTADERALLEQKVNTVLDYFVADVARNRNLSVAKVRSLANGTIFLGTEAKAEGLVDQLGTMDTAKAYLEKRLNESIEFSYYGQQQQGFLSWLFGAHAGIAGETGVPAIKAQ